MTKSVMITGTDAAVCSAVAVLLMRAGTNRGMFVHSTGDSGRGLRGCECRTDVKLSDRRIISPVVFPGEADVLLAFSAEECLGALRYAAPDAAVLCARAPGGESENEAVTRIRESFPSAKTFALKALFTPSEAACRAAAEVFEALGLSFDELLDAIIDTVPDRSRTDCIKAAEEAE